VVSPYLRKPARRLEDVLRDRGLSRADVGLAQAEESVRQVPPSRSGRPSLRERLRQATATHRRASGLMIVGGIAVAAVLSLFGAGLWHQMAAEPAPLAEEGIEALRDIAPAAGPGGGRPNSAAGEPIPSPFFVDPDLLLSPNEPMGVIDPTAPIDPR
jgi:hypothetical protein